MMADPSGTFGHPPYTEGAPLPEASVRHLRFVPDPSGFSRPLGFPFREDISSLTPQKYLTEYNSHV